jgi:hypothetical protein
MWSCKHCKQEFDYSSTSQKANHSRWCIAKPGSRDTTVLKAAQMRVQNEKLGLMTKFIVKCDRCESDVEVTERKNLHPVKEKYFCGRKCSNFRGSGLEWHKGKRELTRYTTICFAHHEKKCVVCGENKIVAVHHLDENHKNNDPSNLVPMCPTHHQYWHSPHRADVEQSVQEYIGNWINKNN